MTRSGGTRACSILACSLLGTLAIGSLNASVSEERARETCWDRYMRAVRQRPCCRCRRRAGLQRAATFQQPQTSCAKHRHVDGYSRCQFCMLVVSGLHQALASFVEVAMISFSKCPLAIAPFANDVDVAPACSRPGGLGHESWVTQIAT
jgi:hypothetical protein